MKIETRTGLVRINEIGQLEGQRASSFLEEVSAALPEGLQTIEIDLTGTEVLDSGGLAALILIYKQANRHNGDLNLRILNPAPHLQQLFEITRMHRLFEIVPAHS